MSLNMEKDLLPVKAHYFLFNAGTAPVVPFLATLAKQLGFSSTVVGIMFSILSMIGMLAKPLLGYVADRYQRHRLVFISTEILTAVAIFLIMWTPSPPKPPVYIEMHCHSGVTQLRYISSSNEHCLAEKIQNRFQQKVISCQLSCQMEPKLWNIVCKHWLSQNISIDSVPECNNLLSTIDNNIKNNSNLNKLNQIKQSDHIINNNNNNNVINNFNSMNNLELNLSIDTDLIEEKDMLFFRVPHSHAEFMAHNITMYCPSLNENIEPYFKSKCELKCDEKEPLHNYLVQTIEINDNDVLGLYQFWWFFILLILCWIGMAAVVSIGDALCFTVLGDKSHLYGKQRLFGSIGWGLFSILSGLLIDSMSDGIENNYSIVFWMASVILILNVFASMKIKTTQTYMSSNILRDIGRMCASWRCCIFFMWCIFIGLGTALVWNWLFWHLEVLGGSCQQSMKTLQGFVLAVQCFCGELPFFFFSGWILKKIGHINAMNLILLGFGIRFILYSILVDPWYVLPIELLNGITFGLFYSTMTSYASIVAPLGTESTIQGLAGAVFEGVGVSAGTTIAGYLFDSIGGSSTFEIFGIGAFIAFIIHVTAQECFTNKWRTNERQTMTNRNGVVEYFVPSEDMSILTEQGSNTPERYNFRLLNNVLN